MRAGHARPLRTEPTGRARPAFCRAGPLKIQDVELLGHVGVASDQPAGMRQLVDQLVTEDDHAEALAALVPDPRARLLELWECVAQLVDRRLRVEEAPDEDADDQKGSLGS